ncbi:cystatin-like [Arapaima gigas]
MCRSVSQRASESVVMGVYTVLFCISVACLSVLAGPISVSGPVSPDSEEVWEVADYAAVYYNLHSGDKYIYKPTRILDVDMQIHKGFLYTMDVDLSRTKCLNGKTPDLESCVLFQSPEEAKTLKCRFVVLCNPLLEEKQLQDSSCQLQHQQLP